MTRGVSKAVLVGVALLISSRATLGDEGKEASAADLFAKAAPAVVKIIVRDAKGADVKQGSGFLLTPDGWIATNHHVLDGARGARVLLPSGASFEAEGAGPAAPESDTALLKVAGKDLPFLELSTAENPPIGTRVYAIGAPEGLANSLSEGLVSGYRPLSEVFESIAGKLGRKLVEGRDMPLIQTTAAISHGSSGGPLLLANGTVVGLTTLAIKSGQSLNFAIPVATVRRLMLEAKSAVKPFQKSGAPEEEAEDATDVVRWKSGPIALSIRMPAPNTSPGAMWTVGSTITEVLAIEGRPASVTVTEKGGVNFFMGTGEP